MIQPLPVQPPPLDDAAMRRPVADDAVTGNGMAFVTILSVLAVRNDEAAPLPVATNGSAAVAQQARVFNQDGFFGSATTAPAGTVAGQDATASVQNPMTDPATTPLDRIVEADPFLSPPPASMRTNAAPAAPVASVDVQASIPVQNREIGEVPDARLRPDRSAPASAPVRRERVVATTPAMTTPVAVALHATRHGLDIVARLAATDPGDRRQLTDEIAAFLSAHGYPPGRIAVLAPAALSPVREDR